MNVEYYLQRLLPHRLDALAILDLLVALRLKWREPKAMQVLVEGKTQFSGTTNLLTNPVLESGILHERALLEFVGLRVRSGSLENIPPKDRRKDDAGIEKIPYAGSYLKVVTPAEAAASHPADPSFGVTCLVAAWEAAGKGVAHATTIYPANPTQVEQVGIAAQMIQAVVEKHVYRALGRTRPPPPIESVARQ
jgi:hypothetical protein